MAAYSNYGIFLGQQSAAHAAGMSAPELLSAAIFQPLGMTRSGPTQAELFKDDNRAAAHDFDGSVMPYENVDDFSGAGAIVSTGADIARWMRMLLAQGMFEGRPVLAKQTVTGIFAASMVQGIGGPLQDPNDSAWLGCESYHFLRYRVIEKNGALNGMRTIVTLIPEIGLGIAVFANKQLTVLPEAVRAEFLERELGPSGRDLQAQIRGEQAAGMPCSTCPGRRPSNAPDAELGVVHRTPRKSPVRSHDRGAEWRQAGRDDRPARLSRAPDPLVRRQLSADVRQSRPRTRTADI